ncbi:MAG: hypothetical protein U5K00_08160 [Melioribacteraceae bacterium]|nr:hypothetical protein [Melioribacteraceae bacterium]
MWIVVRGEGIAVKAIDHWEQKRYVLNQIFLVLIATLPKKESFDAYSCPESDIRVAKHPTPGGLCRMPRTTSNGICR